MSIDRVRAEETARVTDAVLDEIGVGDSLPPTSMLIPLIHEIAAEIGVHDLTEHEARYIAEVNLAWVWKDIDPALLAQAKAARSRQH